MPRTKKRMRSSIEHDCRNNSGINSTLTSRADENPQNSEISQGSTHSSGFIELTSHDGPLSDDKALKEISDLKCKVENLYTEKDCRKQEESCIKKFTQPPKFLFTESRTRNDDPTIKDKAVGGKCNDEKKEVLDKIHGTPEEAVAEKRKDYGLVSQPNCPVQNVIDGIKETVQSITDVAKESCRMLKDTVTHLANPIEEKLGGGVSSCSSKDEPMNPNAEEEPSFTDSTEEEAMDTSASDSEAGTGKECGTSGKDIELKK